MRRLLGIIFIVFLTSSTSLCQQELVKSNSRKLPLARSWFEDKNIDLPLPYGVSAFFTYMSRGVDITDVEVAFQNQPKQSINDFTSFELQNKSTVAAVKLDVWVLPFINVYGLFGYVSTNASLDATLTIDRIILPGPPVVIPISNNSTINGNYFGIGSTIVGGYGSWFMLGDFNYGYSNLSELDGKIDFWMFSARTGFQSMINTNKLRTWIGGMYLLSNRTLNLSIEDDILGLIQVDVHQQTENPWTLQLGTSISLGKHFEILAEMGTNFSNASIGVLSGTYRF